MAPTRSKGQLLSSLTDPLWWRTKCLEDLFFLCRNVLSTLEDPTPGFKDLYPPTHQRLAQFLMKYAQPGQKCMVLMPRGWVKSYITTVGWTIQKMLRNLLEGKREHMIISNATLPNAKEMLDKIKFNFQYNELLRGLFKDVIPKDPETQADLWNKDEINLAGNRIEIGSAEGNLVSRHYTIGINDDLVNRDNTNTSEQIEKVKDWWRLFQSLLNPTGIELIIGTRWDEEDLYGMLRKEFLQIPRDTKKTPWFEWHRGIYHLLDVMCYLDPETKTGSTFPVLFPDWRLHEIEAQQKERFGGQYLNDPLSMENKPFKMAWLRRTWGPGEIPTRRMTMILVDPSGKGKDTGDPSGIVGLEAGVDRNLYVRVAERKHITDLALIDRIVDHALDLFPDMIGIEENKYGVFMDLMALYLPQVIRQKRLTGNRAEYIRNLPHICMELKPHGRPKQVRIQNLTGWFESGRIFLALTGMEDLIEELLRFPSSKQDNIIDALAYVLDVVVFPNADDPEKPDTLFPVEMSMTAEQREKAEFESLTVERDQRGLRPWSDYKEDMF